MKLFYTKASCCISNNVFTSKYFELQRRVRQVIEILACFIRQNIHIRGINIGERMFKVLQYADDMNGVMAEIVIMECSKIQSNGNITP